MIKKNSNFCERCEELIFKEDKYCENCGFPDLHICTSCGVKINKDEYEEYEGECEFCDRAFAKGDGFYNFIQK